jgi:exonuclease III
MSGVFMKPRILSWNVRGLNEGSKCLKVRNLLKNWKVNIVCIQETKLDAMSCSIVLNSWSCSHVDWCCLDSIGALGGILIMWDKKVVEKVDECVGVYSLAVSFRNIANHSTWAVASVYGPNLNRDRRLLWDELAGLLIWWNLTWCIGGEFNVRCDLFMFCHDGVI